MYQKILRPLLLMALTVSLAKTASAQAIPDFTFDKEFSVATTRLETAFNVTFSITNNRPALICCLNFLDVLPVGLETTGPATTNGNCPPTGAPPNILVTTTTIQLLDTNVDAGATCVITVPVKATNKGVFTNTTTVTAIGRAPSTDSATVTAVEPDLTLTKTHVGNFTQGQLGATYTITATNSSVGATAAATLGLVTVTDTLPAGLTATAIVGAGWTCTLAPLACTRSDALAPGASYPPITVTVNVAPNAPATVINSVAVAGGGEVLAATMANNTALDTTTVTPLDFFQIRYASNLTSGDSVINITNTGANGASLTGPGFGGAVGNICVNVYAFSPDEQLISCCSCPITPNGLVSLSVNSDLVSNTLTGVRPNSVVVKFVNTGATATFSGTSCTNSAALAGTAAFPLAGGFQAFGTTIHATAAAAFASTETPFSRATLSPGELASITNRCTNIIGNGSTFGICRSCRSGGLQSN